MRKLKLQMHTTIDGFVGRPGGGMDWVTFNWDEALRQFLLTNLDSVDCILMAMGRKSEMQFIPYWASVAAKPSDPFFAYGKKLTDAPKVVLSNTLTHSEWPLTSLVNGDFVEATKRLKEGNGGDIIVFGGARLASSLIANHLVDEIHLLVNPVAIGGGLPIFRELESQQEMILAQARSFDCGIVWLHYGPKTNQH